MRVPYTGGTGEVTSAGDVMEGARMTVIERYAQGTPAWVDLQSPDLPGSQEFYRRVFGWQYHDQRIAAGRTYSIASVDGHQVAGIAPQEREAVAAGVPTDWNTYFSVDDVDATVARVAPAGGRVVLQVADVADLGRQAVVEDSVGATLMLWEANNHIGASLVDAPGSIVWHELAAGTWEYAVPFYLDVFGVDSHSEHDDGGSFTVLRVDGHDTAGFSRPEDPHARPRWEVYFGADDVDRCRDAAVSAGGAAPVEPIDVPGQGRMAMLRDPQGAEFWVLQTHR